MSFFFKYINPGVLLKKWQANRKLGGMAHTRDSSTQESEAGASEVQGNPQFGLRENQNKSPCPQAMKKLYNQSHALNWTSDSKW